MKYFDYERIARGYALDRPIYHIEFIDRVKNELNITQPFIYGLDIGCGAGSSSIALKKICKNVLAIDESGEMIKAAEQYCNDKSIVFQKCSAENFPLQECPYDVITAAGSINWIDETVFLKRVHDALSADGLLIIYDNPMIDRMINVPSFTDWWNNEYLQHFPKPYRKETVWDNEMLNPYGLTITHKLAINNQAMMSLNQLVHYLITQTNVISKIEHQGENLNDTINWFKTSLAPYFNIPNQTVCFEGYIWIISK